MRGMGQDDTRTLSPLQRITEVKGDFFFPMLEEAEL